jgi:hypothetical protein
VPGDCDVTHVKHAGVSGDGSAASVVAHNGYVAHEENAVVVDAEQLEHDGKERMSANSAGEHVGAALANVAAVATSADTIASRQSDSFRG